jgi:LysM repeat protein
LTNQQKKYKLQAQQSTKPTTKMNTDEQDYYNNNDIIPQTKEKEYKPLKLKTALFVVGGLHIAAIAGIMGFSAMKSHAEEIKKEDNEFLKNAPVVGVDNPTPVAEVPTATPVPKATPAPTATPVPSPKPKVVTKVPENPNPNYPAPKNNNPKYTTEYVVKQGDTFHKIVGKFKLNPAKLKAINNIKDENKIVVGQKLKFM